MEVKGDKKMKKSFHSVYEGTMNRFDVYQRGYNSKLGMVHAPDKKTAIAILDIYVHKNPYNSKAKIMLNILKHGGFNGRVYTQPAKTKKIQISC